MTRDKEKRKEGWINFKFVRHEFSSKIGANYRSRPDSWRLTHHKRVGSEVVPLYPQKYRVSR